MASISMSSGKVSVCPHAKDILSGETVNGKCFVNSEYILNGKAGQSTKESTQMIETNDQHMKSMNRDHIEDGLGITIERNWIPPNLPSKCTWTLGGSTRESPHNHFQK